MIVLRDYQEQVIYNVLEHLKSNDRCCVSLATGGGKTVIFSELVNKVDAKILICVHREELVLQTSNTLLKEHDVLVPKTKKVNKDVCVAMVQTLHSRIKKGLININDYDFLIIDECHRGEFMKILDQFSGKVVGFTATPNYEKVEYFYKCLKCGSESGATGTCCNKKLKKHKRNVPLAKYYKHLIHGIEIDELIEKGYLVKDENYKLNVDTSYLVYDEARQDYTDESISLVFGSNDAINNTIDVYETLAKGRKTILFNPNTLVNKRLFKAMVKKGINAKMYDSNNSEENRHDLVEWFKNTPDAVLLNVQVFTTGFDCTDVEVVFLNKKTKSINLFLQMVGRGGRITDKILKPSFRVIDMGANIKDLGGEWSAKRDWNSYFYDFEVKEVGKPKPAMVRTCHSCESIIAANCIICPDCGAERLYIGGVTGLPKRDGKLVIPAPMKIVEYCEKNNLDLLQGRKIVYKYTAELFEETKYETFKRTKANGELFKRTKEFIMPYYFALQKSKLEGNRVRTIESFINETIKQIERRYIAGGNI
jgi:superfamily II DNA or RNA helicase